MKAGWICPLKILLWLHLNWYCHWEKQSSSIVMLLCIDARTDTEDQETHVEIKITEENKPTFLLCYSPEGRMLLISKKPNQAQMLLQWRTTEYLEDKMNWWHARAAVLGGGSDHLKICQMVTQYSFTWCKLQRSLVLLLSASVLQSF